MPTTSRAAPEPITLELPGLRLAGLAWGPPDGQPVLALHGWLDNAASFTTLAPLLEGARIVALDLPGHGHSDHRPPGVAYDFLDWVVDLADAARVLGWERFALLGHSMGAAIAGLVAGTLKDRVTRAVLLEGLGPNAVPPGESPERLERAIEQRARPVRAPREAADRAAAIDRLRQVVAGLGPEGARLIVERGTREVESGLAWRADPRLRGTSPFRITEEHVRVFLGRIACPTLLVRARDGYPFDADVLTARAQAVPGLRVLAVDGAHHVHLDHPERLAGPLNAFLRGETVGEPVDALTSLAASSSPPGAETVAALVRVLVLDVDGVLTDGSLVYDATGEAQKVFDVRDGLGIKRVQEAGIEVAIISGRATAAVEARARDLGITHVHQGIKDKVAVLQRLLETLAVPVEQVAYMGDDLVDLGVLARVGLPAAPADAQPEARRLARFVARAPGGKGAVRELCEHLLLARDGRRLPVEGTSTR